MPQRRRSMQSSLGRKQRFVGRVREIAAFRANLTAQTDEDRSFVLTIFGDAGIGKTYLTKHLGTIAREAGAAVAYTDDSCTDVLAVMNAVAKALGADRFRRYTDKYRDYEKHRQELESDPKAPDNTAVFLTRAAVKIGLGAAGSVPVVGAVSGAIDANALADQLVHWTTYVGRKFGNKEASDLITKPVETLTPHFVEALYGLPEDTEIALFFDTYERTSQFLDPWLYDLVDGRYGELPFNLVFVIAGQLRLDRNRWSTFADSIRELPLRPFSTEEIADFLARKQITQPQVVEEITQLSNGLPLLVAMLAENVPSDAERRDATGTAVDRFLRWLPEPRRQKAAVDAALPRFVNLDVLSALVPDEDRAETLEWLRRMPFVTDHPQGYQYHRVVRAAMLRLKRRESALVWTQTHEQLADAAEARRAALEGTGATVYEEVYHRLCARPETYLTTAVELLLESIFETGEPVGEWAALFTAAGQDSDAAELLRWGALLRESADTDDWLRFFDALVAQSGLQPELRGFVTGMRGLANSTVERYEEALADLNTAEELVPGTGVRSMRGEVHRLMGNYDLALRDFTADIDAGIGDTEKFQNRGLTHFDAGNNTEALADFEEALRLNPGEPYLGSLIATVTLRLGDQDGAIRRMNDLVAERPDQAWLLFNRSTLLGNAGRWQEAMADADAVLALDPAYGVGHQWRGQLLNEEGRHEDALAAFTLGIEHAEGAADRRTALFLRGTARVRIAPAGAEADFDAVLAEKPDDEVVLFWRSVARYELGRYAEAVDDVLRVRPEVDPEVRRVRWASLTALGRDDEAAAEMAAAQVEQPDAAWVMIQRAYDLHADDLEGAEAVLVRAAGQATDAEDRASVLLMRASVRSALDRDDESDDDIRAANEASEDVIAAYLGDPEEDRWFKIRVLRAIGRLDDALAMLDDDVSSVEIKVFWLVDADRFAEALDLATAALASSPDSYDLHLNAGTAAFNLMRLDDARGHYRRAAQLEPAEPGHLYALVDVLAVQGRLDESQRVIEDLLALAPAPEVYVRRAWNHIRAGRLEEALADADRVLATAPALDWAVAERAVVAHLRGDSANAIAAARGALAMMSDEFPWDRLNRVMYHLLAREDDKALAALDAALDSRAPVPLLISVVHDELPVIVSAVPDGAAAQVLGAVSEHLAHRVTSLAPPRPPGSGRSGRSGG